MSEKSTLEDPAARHPTASQESRDREPFERDGWLEGSEELPRRPRRRLLTPAPVVMLVLLTLACGFIAGALVEKGQTGSSTALAGGGPAGRLAALRAGQGGPGAAPGAGGSGAGASGSSGTGAVTVGQVAYIRGNTLYVTGSQGNTVRVNAPAGLPVSKTVKTSLRSVHPGETVIVSGAAGSDGAIVAESISIGSGGASLGALFGGGSGATGGGGRGGAGGGTGAGERGSSGGQQALFGK
jgi:hypothetical protein